MKTYTTLIIDDEQLARERLKKLLAGFQKTFTIIGEAKNGNEAEKLIHELKPDLIFLDIEMPGQTGFELLSKLKVLPIVIFCNKISANLYLNASYNLHLVLTSSTDSKPMWPACETVAISRFTSDCTEPPRKRRYRKTNAAPMIILMHTMHMMYCNELLGRKRLTP